MALDRQRIVAEAVALLDAEGLDGVTTRKLAARLGVQSPTLYWHLPNKAALVTAIADAILDQEYGAAPWRPVPRLSGGRHRGRCGQSRGHLLTDRAPIQPTQRR